MGRSKLPIKKIENTTNLQVTFSKRRYGLIKKAYEIAVLCDIDLTLIMLSPSGRLSHFSGRKRVEDVIYRYINLSDRDRGGIIANREQIVNTLTKIKTEKDLAMQSAATPGSDTEEIQKEILDLQRQLEKAQDELRVFEPDLDKFTTLGDFEKSEVQLKEGLRRVMQRKRNLFNKVGQQSSYQDTYREINTVVQYLTEAQTHGAKPLLENEDDQGIELSNIEHVNFGSDACSANLRKQSSPTMYESVSQTSGNENAQTVEACSNNVLSDDAFQQFHSSKNHYTSLLQPDNSTHFKDVLEGSNETLAALDEHTMFLPSQCHQQPSSELHL
ncbi:agamous-like MADS-box protein AGL104 [Salvia miltiorrhiza]|uniref:agamous-like MADS-box protein AGL104 n=1 Tax=Salvia miltiorrhiza TaxID=226208 RepID=UPI0025ACFC6A|nr:agamous-like MADS-box protein AGL104 [Salvia miltiorrhiza]